MFLKVIAVLSVVLYIAHDSLAREIYYNVPKQLRLEFMSPSGRYKPFQGIDCTQPLEMEISCKSSPVRYIWHWDHETKSCEHVPYFGCQPTRNHFYSNFVCDSTARPVCTRLPDDDRYMIF